jgi:hypothetical protein
LLAGNTYGLHSAKPSRSISHGLFLDAKRPHSHGSCCSPSRVSR